MANIDSRIIYSEEELRGKVAMLALHMRRSMLNDCKPDTTAYVCIMTGAVQFFAQITAQLPPAICYYTKAKAYIDDGKPMDKIEITPISEEFNHYTNNISTIVIFDDICDTGRTLQAVVKYYQNRYPNAAISTSVLIHRKCENQIFFPNFSAIETNIDAWFVGFGLDSHGIYRNLQFIYDTKCNDNKDCESCLYLPIERNNVPCNICEMHHLHKPC